MVSTCTILAIVFSLLACFAFPILLCIFFLRKTRPGIMPVLIGAAVFIVFALILEQILHYAILSAIPQTSAFLKENDWAYVIYGAMAAGIFEEFGRFLAFFFIMKKKREWKHGIAYGIGHGGIEAVLLIFPAVLNNLIYAVMINTGSFDSLVTSMPGGASGAAGTALMQVRDSLLTDSSWLFAAAGFERIFTIIIQIALSLVVLYAVYTKKYLFVGLAILLHAAIDVPAVLFQRGVLPLWVTEIIVGIIAVAGFIFILKSKLLFAQKENEPAMETTEAHP